MPPVIHDARPAARGVESLGTGRVGGDPRDTECDQQALGYRRRPGRVPRFADHGPVVQAAEQAEEAPGYPRIEGERRRQLHQEWTERVAERSNFVEEPGQRLACRLQSALVGDELGDLDREAEQGRHGGGPPLVDRGGVRAMEGRVDFDGVQAAGVALELRAVGSETVAV